MSVSDVVQSLAESSSLTADQSARLERVLEDYLKSLEQGQHPDPIAIIREHSDIAESLQEYLTKIEALHRTALGLSNSQAALSASMGATQQSQKQIAGLTQRTVARWPRNTRRELS